MAERRREKRNSEVNRVSIEYLIEEPIEKMKRSSHGLMEDISLGGIKILSDTFFPVGKVIKVVLTLKGNTKPIYMIGKVKWNKNISNEVYEVGLEIVDTFKETIQALIEHFYGNEN
jgi:hypothetical protein